MAQTNETTIQLYHSTTPSSVPTSGNMANGELAINIADGKIFYKNASGTVVEYSSGVTTGKAIAMAIVFGG
jgi:hypothetical protein